MGSALERTADVVAAAAERAARDRAAAEADDFLAIPSEAEGGAATAEDVRAAELTTRLTDPEVSVPATVAALRREGFGADEVRRAGAALANAADVEGAVLDLFDVAELRAAGVTLEELQARGRRLRDLATAYSMGELLQRYSLEELEEAGLSLEDAVLSS